MDGERLELRVAHLDSDSKAKVIVQGLKGSPGVLDIQVSQIRQGAPECTSGLGDLRPGRQIAPQRQSGHLNLHDAELEIRNGLCMLRS